MARKKQKPGNMQSLAKFKKAGEKLRISNYEISYDPIKGQNDNLPKPVKDRLQDLHDMVKGGNPDQAIEELLVLKEEYPDVPMLYNYLSAAYEALGNHAASRETIIENYQKNPDYLFAKINYAQICLMNGETDKVPEIFDGKLDLKLLYPNRNRFHVTEFSGLSAVVCAYYAASGQHELAQKLYKTLLEMAPDSEMTRFALRFVYPSLLSKLSNLIGR